MQTYYAVSAALVGADGILKPNAFTANQVRVFKFTSRSMMDRFLMKSKGMRWLSASQMTAWRKGQTVQIIDGDNM